VVEGEDPQEADKFIEEWKKVVPNDDVGLVVIESPLRSFRDPLMTYINSLDGETPGHVVTVVIPEFVPQRFWEYFLHNQTTLRLKLALLFRPNTVVMNVPYVMGGKGSPGAARSRRSAMLQFSWIPVLGALVIILLLYFFLAG
jgi:hypothetical protein